MGQVLTAAPARAVRPTVESLEGRQLMTAAVTAALPGASAAIGGAASTVDLAGYFNDPTPAGTLVTLDTTLGFVPIQLLDAQTPLTVENFLKYVNAGRYNNSIFHRSVPDFVVQGGGFTAYGSDHIPEFGTVQNEFSPTRSNLRGTVAMAKKGGDPNSASSEWFFNLADNSSNLDNQNGGFTVFGNVTGGGMGVVDAIAAVPNFNGGGAFTNIPLRDFTPGPNASPGDANYIKINSAAVDYKYTVTVDDPDVLEAKLFGQVLKYSAKNAGVANVTVTADDGSGQTASQTFQVVVDAKMVKIGSGGAKAVRFQSAQGGTVTVSLTGGGSADVWVSGSGVTVGSDSKGATVTGTGLTLGRLDVTGTRNSSKLTIKSGNTFDMTGRVTSAKTIGNIDAGRVNFLGELTSAASLGNVLLKSIGGTWTVTGGAKRLKAESTAATFNGTFTGTVSNIDVRRTMSGSLAAATVGTVKAGKLEQGSLNLTRSTSGSVLKKLDTGSLTNYDVRAIGGLGDLTSRTMTDSNIVAGGLKAGLSSAATTADFAKSGATIKSLTLRATRDAFVDSSVIAGRITRIALGTFNDTAGDAAFFGVQADRIGSLTAKVNGKTVRVISAADQATVDAELAQQQVALTNFKVRAV